MQLRTIALMGMLAGVFPIASTAAFADDPMANTYANTVTTTNKATGAKGTLLFSANNTYTASATGDKGQPVNYSGTWAMKDANTICLTPNIPNANPPPPTSCSPLVKHNVGDTWPVTNDQNETFDVSLTPGR